MAQSGQVSVYLKPRTIFRCFAGEFKANSKVLMGVLVHSPYHQPLLPTLVCMMPSSWGPVVVSPFAGKDPVILKQIHTTALPWLCSCLAPWHSHDGACRSRCLWKLTVGSVFPFGPPGPLKYHGLKASLRTWHVGRLPGGEEMLSRCTCPGRQKWGVSAGERLGVEVKMFACAASGTWQPWAGLEEWLAGRVCWGALGLL